MTRKRHANVSVVFNANEVLDGAMIVTNLARPDPLSDLLSGLMYLPKVFTAELALV